MIDQGHIQPNGRRRKSARRQKLDYMRNFAFFGLGNLELGDGKDC